MRITIANNDCSADLGPVLKRRAERTASDPRCLFLPPFLNALSLKDCNNAQEYLETLLRLLRYKNHVDTRPYSIPGGRGIKGRVGRLVKKLLWKAMRYQHDRITFRQNTVNTYVTAALEFELDHVLARVADLEQRIKTLESQSPTPGATA